MSQPQVVYRFDPAGTDRWQAHLAGGELHLPASTLAEAQHLMRATLSGGGRHGFGEHVEHPLGDGVYLRQALDRESVDRGRTATVLTACLTDRRVLDALSPLVDASPAGVSVVTCLPHDPVSWILAQQRDGEALVVGTAVCNTRAWWNALVSQPTRADRQVPALDELGLLEPWATVDTWMVKTPVGQTVTPARHDPAADGRLAA